MGVSQHAARGRNKGPVGVAGKGAQGRLELMLDDAQERGGTLASPLPSTALEQSTAQESLLHRDHPSSKSCCPPCSQSVTQEPLSTMETIIIHDQI